MGSIRSKSSFWKETLKASSFVQNVVEFGHFIPFTSQPEFSAKNNSSSFRNNNFVAEAILKLFENKCITELDQTSYCCNPLTVAETS